MEIEVCERCKNSTKAYDHFTGAPVCPICDNRTFIKVTLPDTVKCTYCKEVKKIEDVLKIWRDIPFFDAKTGTYYCGCRGWD